MKKIIVVLLFVSSVVFAKVNAIVSILPQKTFVDAIGGDKVAVTVMVQPGNSPHAYEPKPSQMKDIAKAAVYFAIGVEFEQVWLDKFTNQNAKMKLFHLEEGIEKISMQKPMDHHSHKHKEGKKDPHIWTSPENVKVIAQHIYEALVKTAPEHQAYFQENFQKFLMDIDKTDTQIKSILKTVPQNAKFMVFHPAWGYFAKQYGLDQLPIEVEGKSPKPQALAQLIKEAREAQVKAIFTQPEFSDKAAKQIANELHIKVIKTTPLAPQWSQNLINLANAVAGELK